MRKPQILILDLLILFANAAEATFSPLPRCFLYYL